MDDFDDTDTFWNQAELEEQEQWEAETPEEHLGD